jgi:hypothetical protein
LIAEAYMSPETHNADRKLHSWVVRLAANLMIQSYAW